MTGRRAGRQADRQRELVLFLSPSLQSTVYSLQTVCFWMDAFEILRGQVVHFGYEQDLFFLASFSFCSSPSFTLPASLHPHSLTNTHSVYYYRHAQTVHCRLYMLLETRVFILPLQRSFFSMVEPATFPSSSSPQPFLMCFPSAFWKPLGRA